MQPLIATDILDIWERGVGHSPVKQALVILSHAFPQMPAGSLSRLTIGQRDAYLLQLRARTFGPLLSGLVTCPSCAERLEMSFDSGDFQPSDTPELEPELPEAGDAEIEFAYAPYQVTYRLPNSIDLSTVAGLSDAELARQQLLEACVLDARKNGARTSLSELSGDAIEALSEHISQADPLADLTLDITCPACRHSWQVIFDIVTFFWAEIEARAVRLMREVHILASAYGWREVDILGMSVWRRQRYLEMVGADA